MSTYKENPPEDSIRNSQSSPNGAMSGELSHKLPTLVDLWNQHQIEKHAEEARGLWTVVIARPLSFLVTWLFVRLRISANQATYLSFLFALVGCVLLAAKYSSRIWGVGLVHFWYILDCVDGNLARYYRQKSSYGHFLDIVGALFVYALFPLFLGIGVFREPDGSLERNLEAIGGYSVKLDSSIFLVLGAWAAIAITLSRLVRMYYLQVASGERAVDTQTQMSQSVWWRCADLISWNLVRISGMVLPLLTLAVVANIGEVFLLFYAVLYSVVLVGTLVAYSSRLRGA